MARIKTYSEVNPPSLDDILIGTSVNESDATKNFKISDILALSGEYVLPVASTVTLGGVKIDGTTITIDGSGIITANYSTAAIIAEDQGNGIGYFVYNREPTKYSPIGLRSIDLTVTPISEPLTTYGVESLEGFSTGSANRLPAGVGNYGGHQAHGYGNTVYGYYGNMAFGAYNSITNGYNFVTFGYTNTAAMTAQVGHGFSAGGFNSSTSYWNNALGFRISASAKGFTGVGLANTVYTGSATAPDRPAFTVGIGDASSNAGAGYGNVISRKDGFVVKFNGEVVLPETTIAIIDAEATGKSLVTKEWAYRNVGGLYAQTALGPEVRFVDGETSLIGSGVGVLTVPANSFQVGDSFVAKMCGNITCANNQQIRLRVDTNGVLLIDTGTFELALTTNKVFDLVIDFTITKIGGNGVAEIFTNASFTHNQDASNTMIGYNVNNINSTTFDTTINNTLTITAEWIDNNAANVMQSQNFTLKRVY